MDALISIIVPIYNTNEVLLGKCINSLVNQTYSNIEIIMVDDGSKQTTALFCKELAGTDPRIRLIHKPNGGLSTARNSGIDVAKGEFYSFVDSDDYIHPEAIQRMYEAHAKTNCKIVCMRSVIINEYDKVLYHFGNDSLATEHIGWADYLKGICEKRLSESVCDKLFKSDVFNTRFESGRLNEDFLFLSNLLMTGIDVVLLDFAGYYYLKHEGTITSHNSDYTSLKDAILNSCQLANFALSRNNDCYRYFAYSALFQTKVLMTLLPMEKIGSEDWNLCLSVLRQFKFTLNKCGLRWYDRFMLMGLRYCPKIMKYFYAIFKGRQTYVS